MLFRSRKTVTRHQIIQVLRHKGAEPLQERRIEYDPDHQHATLDWTRVLKTDGTLWCWGLNNVGQLGRSTSAEFDPVPAPVVF